MNRRMRTMASVGFSTALGMAMLLAAGTASAQVPVAPAQPDHDLWVGRIGLGWYGSRSVPLGPGGQAQNTPLVGMRYWVNSMIGIDGALGLMHQSSSTTQANANTSTDTSNTSFAIHAGVPISIFNMTHYSFQITPELDFGYATGSGDVSGILFQIGARGGAEVFFGFMGLPQLSLDASVGLFLASRTGNGPNGSKHSDLYLQTLQFNNPWDIFTSTVAARYYF